MLRPEKPRTLDGLLTPELEETWDRIRLEAEEERALEARSQPRQRRRIARDDGSGTPNPPPEAATRDEAAEQAAVAVARPATHSAREEVAPGIDGLVDLLRAIFCRAETAAGAIRRRRAQYGAGRTEAGRGTRGRHASVEHDEPEQLRRRTRAWAEESLLSTAFRVAGIPYALRNATDRAWYHALKSTRDHLLGPIVETWVEARTDEISRYAYDGRDIDVQEAARRLDCRADWASVSHLRWSVVEPAIRIYSDSHDAIRKLLKDAENEAGVDDGGASADEFVAKLRRRRANAQRRLHDAKTIFARQNMYRRYNAKVDHLERKERDAPSPPEPTAAEVPTILLEPTVRARIEDPMPHPPIAEELPAATAPQRSRVVTAEEHERLRRTEEEGERFRRENGPGFHGMMRLVREILDGTTTPGQAVVERRGGYAFDPPVSWGAEAVVENDEQEQTRRRALAIAEEALLKTLGRVHATSPNRRTQEEDWWLIEIEDAPRDKRRRLLDKWIDDHCRAIENSGPFALREASSEVLAHHERIALAQVEIAEAFATVGTRERELATIKERYRTTLLEAGINTSTVHPATIEGSDFAPLLAQLRDAERALQDAELSLADARAKRDGKAPEPARPKRVAKPNLDRLRYEDGGPGIAELDQLATSIIGSELDASGAIELRRQACRAIGEPPAWGVEAIIPQDPELERHRRAHALAEEAVLRQIHRVGTAPDDAADDERRWLKEVENGAYRKAAIADWVASRRKSILRLSKNGRDLQIVAAEVERHVLDTYSYRSRAQKAVDAYLKGRDEVGEAGMVLDAVSMRMRLMHPGDKRYPELVRQQTLAKRQLEGLTDRMMELNGALARARTRSADPPGGAARSGSEASAVAAPAPADKPPEVATETPAISTTTYEPPLKRALRMLLEGPEKDDAEATPSTPSRTTDAPAREASAASEPAARPPEPRPDAMVATDRGDNVVFLPAFSVRDRRNEPHPLAGEAARRAAVEAEDRSRAEAEESRRKAVADARERIRREELGDDRERASLETPRGPSREAERDRKEAGAADKAAREAETRARILRPLAPTHAKPIPAAPSGPPKWGAPQVSELRKPTAVRVSAEQKQAVAGIGKSRGPGRPPSGTAIAPRWNDTVTLRSHIDAIEQAGRRRVGSFATATWSEVVALAMWADSVLILSAPSFAVPVVLAVRRPRSALVADWHRTVTSAFNALPPERRNEIGPIYGRVSILEPKITVNEVLACLGRLGMRIRLGKPGPDAAANLMDDDE